MSNLNGRIREAHKPAREYNELGISSRSMFGIGATPTPRKFAHDPGGGCCCIGCGVGCGSSQAKNIS